MGEREIDEFYCGNGAGLYFGDASFHFHVNLKICVTRDPPPHEIERGVLIGEERKISSLRFPLNQSGHVTRHAMWHIPCDSVSCIAQCYNDCFVTMVRVQSGNSNYSTMVQTQMPKKYIPKARTFSEPQYDNQAEQSRSDDVSIQKHQIGENVSRRDKAKFLENLLLNLKDSKEAVYGTLDAWVAWESDFPTISLKRALLTLEKQQQWHRVIQVIKWMLSKGRGTTMGIYGQLIRALDMDNRAEEAHRFWLKKIGHDLHSVPWQLCNLIISMYYRNNMFENLVKLFKGLEAFDRKPQEKLVVQKVANAYEMLGLLDEQKRVLEKYNHLFVDTWKGCPKNVKRASKNKTEKSGGHTGASKHHKTNVVSKRKI
ncbi:hypothetical protein GIB67_023088 [Kingdonia uniflora]|uniref:Pentatricopeptide repeat-containing protein n=1 Tax=Kingdonia uniflora TaxID=39325 RepID=A0A7J7M5I8_9MAGN|nr:hypothetical protein GIB67_023088 [Kingdonia uniflora]